MRLTGARPGARVWRTSHLAATGGGAAKRGHVRGVVRACGRERDPDNARVLGRVPVHRIQRGPQETEPRGLPGRVKLRGLQICPEATVLPGSSRVLPSLQPCRAAPPPRHLPFAMRHPPTAPASRPQRPPPTRRTPAGHPPAADVPRLFTARCGTARHDRGGYRPRHPRPAPAGWETSSPVSRPPPWTTNGKQTAHERRRCPRPRPPRRSTCARTRTRAATRSDSLSWPTTFPAAPPRGPRADAPCFASWTHTRAARPAAPAPRGTPRPRRRRVRCRRLRSPPQPPRVRRRPKPAGPGRPAAAARAGSNWSGRAAWRPRKSSALRTRAHPKATAPMRASPTTSAVATRTSR